MMSATGMAKREKVDSHAQTDPDLPLLRAMGRGDAEALAELYRLRGPALLAYLTARLDDRGLAEEVLQDVMLAAWQAAGRFRGQGRVTAWLLAIARTRAINAYNRQVRPLGTQVALDEGSVQENWGPSSSDNEELSAGLRALPAEQRETLELVFYHGLSLQETAQVMSVAAGTVKSRLHRARKRLAQWIMEEEDDE
jgi:RNA polymerase sigma-70 factor (ECF subfamily)